MTKSRQGIFYAIVGAIFWGASGTVAQGLFSRSKLSPLWLVGIRLFFAGLLLLIWYQLTTGKTSNSFSIWQKGQDAKTLILFSYLGMLPSQLTYFLAINYGNAPTATVLQFLGPIFIIIYLALAQRTWPQRINIISILLAVCGTFLLVTNGHFNSLSLSPLALLWGIGAGLSQASYTLLPGKLLTKYDPRLVVGWAMLLGSLPFIPYIAFYPLPQLDGYLLGNILFIIIFGTMLAYLFYLTSLRFIQPSVTSMLSSFEPLTATVLSFLFLQTVLGKWQIIGAGAILATLFLQLIPTKAKKLKK